MMISEAGSLESLAHGAGKLAKYDSILLILNADTLIVFLIFIRTQCARMGNQRGRRN